MRIWLSKPIYELLPYFYVLVGSACLLASLYWNYWYWPLIGAAAGVVFLLFALVVFVRRRDFRTGRQPAGKDRHPG